MNFEVFGMIAHTMTGGRRDFSSVSGMTANRYDIVADEEVADEAVRRLQEQPRDRSST